MNLEELKELKREDKELITDILYIEKDSSILKSILFFEQTITPFLANVLIVDKTIENMSIEKSRVLTKEEFLLFSLVKSIVYTGLNELYLSEIEDFFYYDDKNNKINDTDYSVLDLLEMLESIVIRVSDFKEENTTEYKLIKAEPKEDKEGNLYFKVSIPIISELIFK